jgi:cell division protein FtsI/penicillin-binding protein 2
MEKKLRKNREEIKITTNDARKQKRQETHRSQGKYSKDLQLTYSPLQVKQPICQKIN